MGELVQTFQKDKQTKTKSEIMQTPTTSNYILCMDCMYFINVMITLH